jgi:hypothetical protein
MQTRARTIIETTSKSLGIVAPLPKQHRNAADDVQSLWRRHGWVPPTELGKDFRASLRNTVDRLAVMY